MKVSKITSYPNIIYYIVKNYFKVCFISHIIRIILLPMVHVIKSLYPCNFLNMKLSLTIKSCDKCATFEDNRFCGSGSKIDEVLLCSGFLNTTVFVQKPLVYLIEEFYGYIKRIFLYENNVYSKYWNIMTPWIDYKFWPRQTDMKWSYL